MIMQKTTLRLEYLLISTLFDTSQDEQACFMTNPCIDPVQADAINLMREKGIPGAGGAIKVLDGRASKRELSVTIPIAEMARAHVADDTMTSDDEAQGSPDSTNVAQDPRGGRGGGEGGQGSEAQGMGQPFGLSI